jgi:hypothetical protein
LTTFCHHFSLGDRLNPWSEILQREADWVVFHDLFPSPALKLGGKLGEDDF